MPESNGRLILEQFAKQWKARILLSHFIVAVAITVVIVVTLYKFVLLPLVCAIPILIIIFSVIVFLNQQWRLTVSDVAAFLNRHYPDLQESAQLALVPEDNLNFLQKLQLQKIEQGLANLTLPGQMNKRITSSFILLLATLIISFILFKLPILPIHRSVESGITSIIETSTLPAEKILPEIKSVGVQVVPPSYTGRRLREQSRFNIIIEDGGQVKWYLTTNVSVRKLSLLFNDKQVLSLSPLNKEHTDWSGQKAFNRPGFYQVAIDGKVSEFYKIEIIKDLAPIINIQTPKPNTVIDFGMPRKVNLSVLLADDYGVSSASISATIASGSGEAVKFKEQQMLFTNFSAGSPRQNLSKQIDLKALGMQPGDELYFYVRAVDNHAQEKRSDVYIVTLPDTAQLMTMDGLANGIDLKPEYFRSERQIIIETEQLIKDKDTLTVQEFNIRSNNLGIDQKLLRLRYGKFLGEESDADIGAGHEHNEAGHNDAADFGNAAKIIDEYTHKHDNAEDATFFEPGQKAQLKATLTEMWKAELQLRLNKPQAALPFEYKALKLLKDLQQKSRVYVAKTGFKSTPLKPEKRLTGELDKIGQPSSQQQTEKARDAYEVSRKAAGVLGLLKTGKTINPESINVLRQTSMQLYDRASSQPSMFLASVTAMNKLLVAVGKKQQPRAVDIATAESGLQKLLTATVRLPETAEKGATNNLSTQYFKNLNSRKGQ